MQPCLLLSSFSRIVGALWLHRGGIPQEKISRKVNLAKVPRLKSTRRLFFFLKLPFICFWLILLPSSVGTSGLTIRRTSWVGFVQLLADFLDVQRQIFRLLLYFLNIITLLGVFQS